MELTIALAFVNFLLLVGALLAATLVAWGVNQPELFGDEGENKIAIALGIVGFLICVWALFFL